MDIRKKNKGKGQSMVEFALVLPILLVLMIGLIESGLLIFHYTAVSTASREASRYGTAAGEGTGGIPRYMDCSGIRDAGKRFGSLIGVGDDDITISYESGPGGSVVFASCEDLVGSPNDIELGNRIVVSVTKDFTTLSLIPFVSLPDITLSSASRRTILTSIALE